MTGNRRNGYLLSLKKPQFAKFRDVLAPPPLHIGSLPFSQVRIDTYRWLAVNTGKISRSPKFISVVFRPQHYNKTDGLRNRRCRKSSKSEDPATPIRFTVATRTTPPRIRYPCSPEFTTRVAAGCLIETLREDAARRRGVTYAFALPMALTGTGPPTGSGLERANPLPAQPLPPALRQAGTQQTTEHPAQPTLRSLSPRSKSRLRANGGRDEEERRR